MIEFEPEMSKNDEIFCGSCINVDLLLNSQNCRENCKSDHNKVMSDSTNAENNVKMLVNNDDNENNNRSIYQVVDEDAQGECGCYIENECDNCSNERMILIKKALIIADLKLRTSVKLSNITKAALAKAVIRKVNNQQDLLFKDRVSLGSTHSNIRAIYSVQRPVFGTGGKKRLFKGDASEFKDFEKQFKGELQACSETNGAYDTYFDKCSEWSRNADGNLQLPEELIEQPRVVIDLNLTNIDELKLQKFKRDLQVSHNKYRVELLSNALKILTALITSEYSDRMNKVQFKECIFTAWVDVFLAEKKTLNSQVNELVNHKHDYWQNQMRNSDRFMDYIETIKFLADKAEIPKEPKSLANRFLMAKLMQPGVLPKRLEDQLKYQRLHGPSLKKFMGLCANEDDINHRDDPKLKDKSTDKATDHSKDKTVKEVRSDKKNQNSPRSPQGKNDDSGRTCRNCNNLGHGCKDCKALFCYTCGTKDPKHDVFACPDFKKSFEKSPEKSKAQSGSKGKGTQPKSKLRQIEKGKASKATKSKVNPLRTKVSNVKKGKNKKSGKKGVEFEESESEVSGESEYESDDDASSIGAIFAVPTSEFEKFSNQFNTKIGSVTSDREVIEPSRKRIRCESHSSDFQLRKASKDELKLLLHSNKQTSLRNVNKRRISMIKAVLNEPECTADTQSSQAVDSVPIDPNYESADNNETSSSESVCDNHVSMSISEGSASSDTIEDLCLCPHQCVLQSSNENFLWAQNNTERHPDAVEARGFVNFSEQQRNALVKIQTGLWNRWGFVNLIPQEPMSVLNIRQSSIFVLPTIEVPNEVTIVNMFHGQIRRHYIPDDLFTHNTISLAEYRIKVANEKESINRSFRFSDDSGLGAHATRYTSIRDNSQDNIYPVNDRAHKLFLPYPPVNIRSHEVRAIRFDSFKLTAHHLCYAHEREGFLNAPPSPNFVREQEWPVLHPDQNDDPNLFVMEIDLNEESSLRYGRISTFVQTWLRDMGAFPNHILNVWNNSHTLGGQPYNVIISGYSTLEHPHCVHGIDQFGGIREIKYELPVMMYNGEFFRECNSHEDEFVSQLMSLLKLLHRAELNFKRKDHKYGGSVQILTDAADDIIHKLIHLANYQVDKYCEGFYVQEIVFANGCPVEIRFFAPENVQSNKRSCVDESTDAISDSESTEMDEQPSKASRIEPDTPVEYYNDVVNNPYLRTQAAIGHVIYRVRYPGERNDLYNEMRALFQSNVIVDSGVHEHHMATHHPQEHFMSTHHGTSITTQPNSESEHDSDTSGSIPSLVSDISPRIAIVDDSIPRLINNFTTSGMTINEDIDLFLRNDQRLSASNFGPSSIPALRMNATLLPPRVIPQRPGQSTHDWVNSRLVVHADDAVVSDQSERQDSPTQRFASSPTVHVGPFYAPSATYQRIVMQFVAYAKQGISLDAIQKTLSDNSGFYWREHHTHLLQYAEIVKIDFETFQGQNLYLQKCIVTYVSAISNWKRSDSHLWGHQRFSMFQMLVELPNDEIEKLNFSFVPGAKLQNGNLSLEQLKFSYEIPGYPLDALNIA